MDSKDFSENKMSTTSTTSATRTIIQAEEEFLAKKSKKLTSVKKSSLIASNGKGKSSKKDTLSQQLMENDNNLQNNVEIECNKSKVDTKNLVQNQVQQDETDQDTKIVTTKKKTKKNKKSDISNQSVSVKTSFNKFDTLEKRNASKDPEDNKKSCHICSKPVYKMEEIKAVKSIFHKNCFRCHECNKLLNVDNYQSNEGVIYCILHFKLLLGPRAVEDNEENNVKKPELIIRENQPVELPPEVVRASLKSDLGLADLQQINLRSRFEMFENPKNDLQKKKDNGKAEDQNIERKQNSIRTKLAKYQKLISMENTNHSDNDNSDDVNVDRDSESNNKDEDDDDDDDDDELTQIPTRERPIGIGQVMQDIREKFEKGPLLSKQDRREECKQEIQNIRSRLFTGKQARIKEMYQQAVAEAEQGVTSVGKVENIERSSDARDLKNRFEKGEFFKENYNSNESNNDVDVFNSGIGKNSRSIFMELDATVSAEKQQQQQQNQQQQQQLTFNEHKKKRIVKNSTENDESFDEQNNIMKIIKSDELLDDVKIETSEISNKFKFFETYAPNVHEKKEFRMTPPREGVVKMPTPENDLEEKNNNNNNSYYYNENNLNNDSVYSQELKEKQLLEKSHTTSKMLNKFREIEENTRKNLNYNKGPKPLKSFTPPPDDARRIYAAESDESYSSQDDYNDDDDDEEEFSSSENDMLKIPKKSILNDSSLNEAKAAARAQSLRAKFEKWEAKDMANKGNEQVDIYSKDVSDESNIESTKSIRERFERMQTDERLRSPARPRHQVNRFI